MTRAVSTVLDVALALVVVGAAVLTLAGAPTGGSPDGNAADDVAETVATTTVDVEYAVHPPERGLLTRWIEAAGLVDRSATRDTGRSPGWDWVHRRTTNGTLAGLLAEAAVGDAALGGRELSAATDGFERAVANATRRSVGGDVEVQVRAVWRPFPGSSVRGSVVAGSPPPADADVNAATVTVPVPTARVSEGAFRDAAGEGFAALADLVAEHTVAVLFPPEQSRRALVDPGVRRRIVVERYLTAADWLGVRTVGRVATTNATAANEALANEMADRFERTLRARYDSPSAAARAVSVGVVVLTVRTWSP